MKISKRLRVPLTVMFGAVIGVMALAGPAGAATPNVYPPIVVLGTTLTATTPSTGVQVEAASAAVPAAVPAAAPAATPASAPAAASTSGLAFTGTNAIGIGALGGLLLVGGGALVLVDKRRKVKG